MHAMKTTSIDLDHLLRAVGDPVFDLRDIGPDHAEFPHAQTIRIGAGVLSNMPDALLALEEALHTIDEHSLSPALRAYFEAAGA